MAKHPNAQLQVYTIWIPRLAFDARDKWDKGGLTDLRAMHFWDEKNVVGNWAFTQLPGYQGMDWDAYLLFDEKASWGEQPPPLISSGSTIIAEKDTIMRNILPML